MPSASEGYRPVWTGNHMDMMLFIERAGDDYPTGMPMKDNAFPNQGQPDSNLNPAIRYCFVDSVSANLSQALERRPSTGELNQSIVANGCTYDLQLTGLHFTYSEFNKEVILRHPLTFTLVFYYREMMRIKWYEQHIFHKCRVNQASFQGKQGVGDSATSTYNTTFWAEEYVLV